MINYSQKDPLWKDLEIVKGMTIGTYGCYIVALSMMIQMPPNLTLQILQKKLCFNKSGELLHPNDAHALGFQKYGYRNDDPKRMCIAETNHFAPAYPKHFFLWKGVDDLIVDSLDGKDKVISKMPHPYHIISWRVYANG